jgi:hypothetical protein
MGKIVPKLVGPRSMSTYLCNGNFGEDISGDEMELSENTIEFQLPCAKSTEEECW